MVNAHNAAANSTAQSDSSSKKLLRPADLTLVIVIIIISILPFFLSKSADVGVQFNIYVENELAASGELDIDTLFNVDGVIGPVEIQVQDGEIAIVHSDCPNKYCISMGATSSPIKPIVCVPNHLMIVISGEVESEYDAIIH